MSDPALDAILGALATVLVAVCGLLGVIYSAKKPSKDKPPVGDTGAALDKMSGTQNEFMQLILADNRTLRDEMREVREVSEDALAQASAARRSQETFVGAVRRYLVKIAASWTGPVAMPLPDESDFHILEDTLPARGGASTTRKEIR